MNVLLIAALVLPLHLPGLEPPEAAAELGDAITTLGADPGLLDEAPGAAPPAFDLPAAALDHPAAVAAGAGGLVVALVGFALYSRLAKSELLDHERRDGVLKLVKERPGISLSDVAEAFGLGWGTAVYHLDRLERAGFVTSERSGARRCYFPVGTVPREQRASLGTLQAETTRTIAQFVIERPGATQTELCEGLGLSASAASKQLTKLEVAGLVRREREWKTVKLHPEPKLSALLAPALATA